MPGTKPEIIEVDARQLEDVARRARQGSLQERDAALIKEVFDSYVYVTGLIKEKNTSLRRLQDLLFGGTTEKTATLIGRAVERTGDKSPEQADAGQSREHGAEGREADSAGKGHGRNSADAYRGAERLEIPHEMLCPGDSCPECQRGTVYEKSPGVVIRITGQAPLHARRFELQKLRCNLCGTVFTAELPEAAGEQKYDATAASMIALLKYGSGLPFNRLEGLQRDLEVPLPASTQWDVVHGFAPEIRPVFERLLWEAAQGDVLHNDDTTVRILELMGERRQAIAEESEPARTGMYTSGVIATRAGHRIALFFSGRRHAGENLSEVLKLRLEELQQPIQMCDGLSRNLPKALQTMVANCMAHARRKFVEIYANFSDECRYVLEELSTVYHNDQLAQDRRLSAQQRLQFHQAQSRQPMARLQTWMMQQLDRKRVEPNSALGGAIRYMLKHWDELTLFLREPRAPLDNNVCERALKKAILHRKNALFYKTRNGARVGDMYMSLIHTCELSDTNPFDYLTTLMRNANDVAATPEQWLPWNYRATLEALADVA